MNSASLPETSASRISRTAAPLRQETVIRLRQALLAGEYAAGSRLVERSLCDRYDVSRTVVREALRQLESEGLVRMVPNRGPIVAVLTLEEAEAIFEVRAALEGLAAQLFALRASAEARAGLQQATAAVEEAFRTGGPAEWLASKDRYYDALFDGAKNDVIRSVVQGLHARVAILRRISLNSPNRQPQTLAEIQDITRTAVAGDPEAAHRAATSHVEAAATAALDSLARAEVTTPQPQEARK